ncbi:MAG: histone deacetylase [Spirochaetes bacterium]|nr:histone deacetylase [Spirochaetota bacterium]
MTTAYLFDSVYLQHDTGWGHPEKPERLMHISIAMSEAPYYDNLLKLTSALPEMKHIEAIHSRAYIKRVEKKIKGGQQYLDSMDTAVCPYSFDVALKAVGGSLAMCDAVMEQRAINGFCALRPPGHHAERDCAAGFCIFNNIAIASRYLQNRHGVGKIAIVDWDVHHGNGTQHSFEQDNTILYISLHEHPHYPGTGSASECGTGSGKGYTINIPMRAGSSEHEYMPAFQNKVIPALDSFKPEIVLISAGFDAHRNDPLSSIRLSSETFGNFTRMIMAVADVHCSGRVISFLEGGYNLQALGESVRFMMDAFVSSQGGANG